MSELAQSLSKCRVEGNTLFLPPMSEGPLANYADVRKALLNAGAKYKRNTFVFPSDAQPFIDRLTGDESVNIKKEFQFFATPPELADRMVMMAEIKEGMCVLEPSAGQGAIISAIYNAFPNYMKVPSDNPSVTVDYYELMPQNNDVIGKKCRAYERWSSSTSCMGHDFLQADSGRLYDRIIANPPFTKNQDIDHIRKMYAVLKPGGIIVTISSISWTFGSQKKQVQFREWLDEVGAYREELPENTFKESGTSVKTMLLKIRK